jgi:hypothetical protein
MKEERKRRRGGNEGRGDIAQKKAKEEGVASEEMVSGDL